MNIYVHELKLALFAFTASLSIYLIYSHQLLLYSDPVINTFLNLEVISVVVSLLSKAYLDGREPGKYFIAWFWSYFINAFFLGRGFYFYNLHLFNAVLWPLLVAVPSAVTTWLVRFKDKEEVTDLPTLQLWSATVSYVAFFFLSKLFLPPLIHFLLPFLVLSFVLSFFAVGGRTSFNLSLVGLFLASGILTFSSLSNTGLILPLMIFAVSVVYYFFTMRLVITQTERGVTGGVVSSVGSTLAFPVFIVIVWLLLNQLYSPMIPMPNTRDFPVIFLPSVVGNTIMDTLKGRRLELVGGGIVGGVGMADGLWMDFLFVLIYFLFFLEYGFSLGTLTYIVVGVALTWLSSLRVSR